MRRASVQHPIEMQVRLTTQDVLDERDYANPKQPGPAKQEAPKILKLGMRGAMLSLPRMEGMIHALTASLSGAVAEVEGGIFKNIAHDLQSVGLVSERQERKFEKDLRYVIDEIKLVYDKNAIKSWQADVVAISKDAVQLYGKQQESSCIR